MKEYILNRKNQKLSLIFEKRKNSKGLNFIIHGSEGFREQPHLNELKKYLSNWIKKIK